ncbi:MAG TPA: SAM-dependent methyltransferase [Amycolatopsis sp.]|uniref:SAM-dependent methyltransferase n=1 Tax=Amycolatopsis sp. TaxID=37632 RepID=UPI002B469F28|nr:SAM-dependent methyltransferase [Amycolatopsis sp.]HKS44336.1 SAM-dependent methyltransferase [Amycolatopsis sp.]
MATNEQAPQLDKPNAARVYDYFIGGKLNYAIDREFAHKVIDELSNVREVCLFNRYWLRRVVRFGIEQGIRQFLDIGSGMPTEGHVHEVAQKLVPESRVVYVDNEPIAVAHSQIVLEGNERAAMVNADGEQPETIFGHPDTRRLLDLREPIMVIMAALVHFIPNDRNPAGLVAQYRDCIAPGSYFALSSDVNDLQDPSWLRAVEMYKETANPLYLRSGEELAALLTGFDIVEPGVVFTPLWRPDNPEDIGPNPERAGIMAVVGRKP